MAAERSRTTGAGNIPLRWMLALRFSGVTVATFLVVTLGIAGFLFFSLLASNWKLSPAEWLRIAEVSAVPPTRDILESSPENESLVEMWLAFVSRPVSTFRLSRIGDVELTMRTMRSARAYLFDGDGILLGCSDAAASGISAGMEFRPGDFPGISETVSSAFSGATDPGDLVRPTGRGAGSFSVAVPIYPEESANTELLGVLAVVFDEWSGGGFLGYTARFTVLAVSGAFAVIAVFSVLFGFLTAKSLVRRINRFSRIAESWSRGDFQRLIQDGNDDEIGILADRLDELAMKTGNLIREKELSAIENERTRMAMDLHDSVKQLSLAASFQLAAARTVRDQESSSRHLDEVESILDEIRRELTSLIAGSFRSSARFGDIRTLLSDYAGKWAQREGIDVSMNLSEGPSLPEELSMDVFRIVQEALSNIARHSGAAHASLEFGCDDGELTIRMTDDGCGMAPDPSVEGLGLDSVKERTNRHGGRFRINSPDGGGTELVAIIPLERNDETE